MGHRDWNAEIIFRRYLYDYMVRKQLHTSAEKFREETGVSIDPVAINDSPCGLLSEWWDVFSDVYSATLRKLETQNNFIARSALVTEHASSSKSSRNEAQKWQPAGPFSMSSDLPVSPDERLIQQFKDTLERWQVANITDPYNEGVRSDELPSPLEMSFGHQASMGSTPLDFCPVPTTMMPNFELSHSVIPLDANQNQQFDYQFPGFESVDTNSNSDHQWFGPQHILNNQVQQLQPVAGNFDVKNLLVPGSFGNQLCTVQAQGSGPSYQCIGLPTLVHLANRVTDKAMGGLVQEPTDRQSVKVTRKRKQPSTSSGNVDNSMNRDISGPLKSKGVDQLLNILKQTDEGANINEGFQIDKSESLPCIEDSYDESDRTSCMEEGSTFDERFIIKEGSLMNRPESFPCIKELNDVNLKSNISGMKEKHTVDQGANVKEEPETDNTCTLCCIGLDGEDINDTVSGTKERNSVKVCFEIKKIESLPSIKDITGENFKERTSGIPVQGSLHEDKVDSLNEAASEVRKIDSLPSIEDSNAENFMEKTPGMTAQGDIDKDKVDCLDEAASVRKECSELKETEYLPSIQNLNGANVKGITSGITVEGTLDEEKVDILDETARPKEGFEIMPSIRDLDAQKFKEKTSEIVVQDALDEDKTDSLDEAAIVEEFFKMKKIESLPSIKNLNIENVKKLTSGVAAQGTPHEDKVDSLDASVSVEECSELKQTEFLPSIKGLDVENFIEKTSGIAEQGTLDEDKIP